MTTTERELALTPTLALSNLSTNHTLSVAERFLIGGAAAAAARTAVAPLDRLKLLAQGGAQPSVSRALSDVYSQEGVRGFWRGNTINVLRIMPNKGVLLSCSDLFRDALRPYVTDTFALGACAGALAGATSVCATYPMDLARMRIAGSMRRDVADPGLLQQLVRIWRVEGPLALYRGASLTLGGAFPHEAIKFGTYDLLRQWSGDDNGSALRSLVRAWCGGLSACVANILTYPNDTLRRRMQMNGSGGETPRYRNALDCMMQMIRHEGWLSLYRGLPLALFRAIPNTGIQFGAYELGKELLCGYRDRRDTLI